MSEVTVVCVAESHADRPYIVARIPLTGFREGLGETERPSLAGDKSVRGSLVGDHYLTRPEADSDPGVLSSTEFRVRYELECRRCGLKVVRRSSNLVPVLERLAEAGVFEISLSGLAAIVTA